jgi:hypothetical protein
LAWCAIQWRVGLGEAGRTWRGLANQTSFVDPLKRGDECHDYYDYHHAALLFGLPLWRVDFYSKPKPIFSDQEPGIYIF